ncbi:hypothetical protein ACFLZ5_04790 [Thermodesulfobacteriota bacterium]
MTAITHEKHTDFHWTPASLTLSIIFGFAATLGVWFLAGLLIMIFMI